METGNKNFDMCFENKKQDYSILDNQRLDLKQRNMKQFFQTMFLKQSTRNTCFLHRFETRNMNHLFLMFLVNLCCSQSFQSALHANSSER